MAVVARNLERTRMAWLSIRPAQAAAVERCFQEAVPVGEQYENTGALRVGSAVQFLDELGAACFGHLKSGRVGLKLPRLPNCGGGGARRRRRGDADASC